MPSITADMMLMPRTVSGWRLLTVLLPLSGTSVGPLTGGMVISVVSVLHGAEQENIMSIYNKYDTFVMFLQLLVLFQDYTCIITQWTCFLE